MKRHGAGLCRGDCDPDAARRRAGAGAQTLAVFTKSQGNPVARSIRIGAETAARAEKLMVFNFIPTSADNVAQQTALAEEALRSKPDAVVFTPTDAKALVPVVAKFTAAGIPVVNVNDRLAGGSVTAYVGTDDVAIARATAPRAAQGDGRQGHRRDPGRPAQRAVERVARVRGFNEALKEFPQREAAGVAERELCAQAGGRRDERLDPQVPADRRRARRQRSDGARRARGARAQPGARR